ncbi:hypothetical protein BC826DRAFT_1084013 [Russula brevipes]|nr:hypothetical protein BC826DRAFT_1084013 [Russula brevipes]
MRQAVPCAPPYTLTFIRAPLTPLPRWLPVYLPPHRTFSRHSCILQPFAAATIRCVCPFRCTPWHPSTPPPLAMTHAAQGACRQLSGPSL